MLKYLKRGLLGAILVIAVLAIGRVVTSFAFVAASVSQTMSANGDPTAFPRLITQAMSGLTHLSQSLAPGARRTVSVLDVPAEIEARRKARDTQARPGEPLIIRIED